METASRPAVRIVCLDANGRVLMLRWQDPHDGSYLWEPPGGGIEAGESPYEAARRELTEETGLDADAIMETPVVVPRDTVWNGKRFIGPETFFVAHFALTEPPLSRLGLTSSTGAGAQGTRRQPRLGRRWPGWTIARR